MTHNSKIIIIINNLRSIDVILFNKELNYTLSKVREEYN